MEGVNHATGDKILIDFTESSKPKIGKIFGKCYNKHGKLMFQLTGFWSESLHLTNCISGES